MTFKHSKFEDSVVMRNLVRIAKKKGMIKDPIQKVASKLDLTPTEDLFENVLKLASGLRANGFEVQANELESNLMLYKRAKVEGDIIEEAHPKGGLEFKDVLGHPKFHTLIEQQMKMVDVAFKEPNGKLAKAEDIIKAVKKIFAKKDLTPDEAKARSIAINFGALIDTVNRQNNLSVTLDVVNMAREGWNFTNIDEILIGYKQNIWKLIGSDQADVSVPNLKQAGDVLKQTLNIIAKIPSNDTTKLTEAEKQELYNNIYGYIAQINEVIESFKGNGARREVPKTTSAPIAQTDKEVVMSPDQINIEFKNINIKINKYKNILSAWKNQIKNDIDNKDQTTGALNQDAVVAISWIDKKFKLLDDLFADFNNKDTLRDNKTQEAIMGTNSNIDKIIKDFGAFKSQWIG